MLVICLYHTVFHVSCEADEIHHTAMDGLKARQTEHSVFVRHSYGVYKIHL